MTSDDDQEHARRLICIIENYIKKNIALGKFREDFDQLYYNSSLEEKAMFSGFMEKLSLATSNSNEASDPESSCMIYEPEFKRYAKEFLKKLKCQG